MKFLFWFLPFLIIAFDILELVQAQDQTGFISLDCGLVPTETNYVEKSTNISYKSDFNYIETGEAKKINDAYRTLFQQQTWSLRSFPHGQRNCYNFNLTANRKYLIRGTFIYGNYDNLNQLPIFDLHIGPNRWTTVTTLGVTNGSIHEMIHVLTQDRLQVCLVKTGDTKPFISSLELRPLNNETYVTQSGSLVAVSRVFFSPTPTFVRYDEDINDRTWVPYIDKNNSVIRTDVAVDTSNFYNVPQVVARTAAIPVDASQPLTIDWTLDEVTALSYIYMHFAEIQSLKANETREFNITYNGGKRWFDYFRPPNFSITTIFNPRAVSSPDGKFSFTFAMTSNSTLPPLINALEIYKVLDLSLLETNQDEVLAMMNIKVTYELNKRPSWQGDPCVPESYRWEGLDCSYPDSEPPRIISLNLTGSNLTGTITSDISKLTQLRELDLSNNGLSGEIPAFFADMNLLTLINLSGNPEINGSVIPDSLQKRIDRNSLKLILDGNQNRTTKSKSKDVPIVAIAASVAGGFSLIVIVAIIFVLTRRKQKPPEEFISLDCGLVPKDTIYREKSTNIVYKSDANYIESGVARKVNAAYMTLSQRQRKIWSLRSFPEGTRNCYNFNLTAKRRYLIRADFVYGNYDDRNQLPSFDLHVGPNKWTSVSVPGLKNSSYHEMIHVLTQDPLQVCLVKTGETTPFISSLQLRPLHNETYGTKSGSLVTISRVYFSPTTLVVRYADDIHDRGWSSYLDSQMKSISTDLFVNTSNFYDVPQAVARNAAVPANESQPLTINWSLNEITTQIYVYMHFAEIQNLEAKGTREFNIYCNGNEHWLSYFRPPKFTIKTIANSRAISSPDGKFNLTLAMTGNSTLPPLINGLELYKVLSLLQLDTDQDEVSAMVNIKRSYGLEKKVSWQGDPCAPQIYLWEGLNCSYPDSKPPRIISLNLRGNKLTGSITPELSKLTQLIELDLSMNDLSGDIPDFFADMKSLKLIKLSGNPNLNGKIPDSLKKRLKSHSITLMYDVHTSLTNSQIIKKKVPVVAIVFGVSALLVILAIFFVFLRWKRSKTIVFVLVCSFYIHIFYSIHLTFHYGLVKRKTRSFSSSITRKDLRIRFPKILEMTNNFERVLGKGGFGTVYHGKLDDTQVAVKMLSSSSAQGYKEFKAEVELLLRVHHRHLVGLVGYCDDGDNLALIYEYMAKGDLHENMSGKHSGNVLSWETRMQIAVEAGQGFISLDCGLVPENTTYVENTINITYKSDADYIDSGSVGKIKDAYTTQFQRQLWSLRSFPDGKRNCYNVNVTANSKYLIRGSFVYGNYDGLNQLPSFDLHIGPNKWSSVTIEGVANFSMTEIIHVVTQERLQVCLVKTGPTTPFISSLELRPLPNQSYVTETGSLTRFARVFFSTSSSVIRLQKTIFLHNFLKTV
ncbi:unnamed protein product [Brassica napus]|uniref:non-specific serine/threonine protein kinase n=1 Tax=Brassica napus TaxID=3708 RepID=A0A816PYL8_BRANA|nr:unnamed protein product [Brassica napus]